LTIDHYHAYLLSKLSNNPIKVIDDVFIWHGCIVDRNTAVVCFLKIYSQLPVNDKMKKELHKNYMNRWAHSQFSIGLESDKEFYTIDISNTWFYIICKKIKGNVKIRSDEDIKNIMILLHS